MPIQSNQLNPESQNNVTGATIVSAQIEREQQVELYK